jgi:hypothetical protein
MFLASQKKLWLICCTARFKRRQFYLWVFKLSLCRESKTITLKFLDNKHAVILFICHLNCPFNIQCIKAPKLSRNNYLFMERLMSNRHVVLCKYFNYMEKIRWHFLDQESKYTFVENKQVCNGWSNGEGMSFRRFFLTMILINLSISFFTCLTL